MKTIEQLEKDNAELIVKLSSVIDSKSCATCNNTGSYDYDDGFGGVCSSPCHCTNNPYSTYSVINITQIKSLVDIMAAAIEDAANVLFPYGMDSDARLKLEEYANKLRGEEE